MINWNKTQNSSLSPQNRCNLAYKEIFVWLKIAIISLFLVLVANILKILATLWTLKFFTLRAWNNCKNIFLQIRCELSHNYRIQFAFKSLNRVYTGNRVKRYLFPIALDKHSIIFGCKHANGEQECVLHIFVALAVVNGVNNMTFECKSSISKYL